MQWVSIYGNHVAVVNGKASWALNKLGWHADIYVDGQLVNNRISVGQLRKLMKAGRVVLR